MERVDIASLIAVSLAMPIAAFVPALLPRLPLPGLVLELVLGVIIGPQVLGLVLVGGGILIMILFPALARSFLRQVRAYMSRNHQSRYGAGKP